MRVDSKNTGQVSNTYDSLKLISNQVWSENIAVQTYFKNILKKENQIPETRT
jgi:hypothetical protein